MKKLFIGFISFAAALAIGTFSISYSSQADHGRPPAPQKPDFVQSVDVSKDYNSTTAVKAL
ncbi:MULTISPECIES: Phr family secreted Rap phosphatase inhibitor [Bacillus]|uniref:Phr family secreted Rap phosphatase inhibitor n=1 Tax=Bacillus TaxID=1386 RepID=UPI003D6624FF